MFSKDALKGQRILVTGGLGFIGSHLCSCLLENGYEIYILDSLTNSSKKSFDNIKLIFAKRNIDISNKVFFFKGDLRDKEFIDYVFKKSHTFMYNISYIKNFQLREWNLSKESSSSEI